MKIKKLYIAIVALALSAGLSSCNDYLDKQPDSRRGLPVRGQNTKNNARTRKGKAVAIAGKKK